MNRSHTQTHTHTQTDDDSVPSSVLQPDPEAQDWSVALTLPIFKKPFHAYGLITSPNLIAGPDEGSSTLFSVPANGFAAMKRHYRDQAGSRGRILTIHLTSSPSHRARYFHFFLFFFSENAMNNLTHVWQPVHMLGIIYDTDIKVIIYEHENGLWLPPDIS